jgi:arsenite methyltransferase
VSCAAACAQGAYATGRLCGRSLGHPGGLELTRRAIELAALPAGARVVDIGCGEGESVRLLCALGFRAVGVDPIASEPAGFPRLRGSAEALPLAPESVDAVLAECSLSLVSDARRALAECVRVLAPGGRLIVADLYARHPAAIGRVRGLHASCVSGMVVREELEESLRAAGFSVDHWEDHSRALGEWVAGFLMAGGSAEELWGAGDGCAAETGAAVRAVRAGYFLLLATREATQEGLV